MNNFLYKLFQLLKSKGIKKTLNICYKRMTGLSKYEENIDTLFYFLNKYTDITQLPPTTGALRELQLCDEMLLRIFDKICELHGLRYWLDWGTLLGAMRHKGFIPWDDDMDISMPREDYNKAMEIFPRVLPQYGIEVDTESSGPMERIGVSYKHRKSGVWLDVLPVDYVNVSEPLEISADIIWKRVKKYRGYYDRHCSKESIDKLENVKKMMINAKFGGEYKIWYHGPEFIKRKLYAHADEDIFPLSKIIFEGRLYCCPNNADKYISTQFGKNYMQFPRSGVEHHGGDDGKLATWSVKNNIDMNVILKELQSIYEKVIEQE